jgi:hypothetical protein
VVVLNLGLWQTELAGQFSLRELETALQTFLFGESSGGGGGGSGGGGGIGVETVVLMLPWRVRDAAQMAPPPKEGEERPFVLFSDERLQEVAAGLRAICTRLNGNDDDGRNDDDDNAEGAGASTAGASTAGGAGAGEAGRRGPRCSVLSPWEISYSPHSLQRDRDSRDVSGDNGWWTDNRHIAPDSDLMAALVQLFLAALT